MALIAMCGANAFLCLSRHQDKKSTDYANADFKLELIGHLLTKADRFRGRGEGSVGGQGEQGNAPFPPFLLVMVVFRLEVRTELAGSVVYAGKRREVQKNLLNPVARAPLLFDRISVDRISELYF
jgi:hypothetical protein